MRRKWGDSLRIAAISDLHIGAYARTDAFGHEEEDFLAFLDHLEATHDRIVLLGDIYQTDHALIPSRRGRRTHLSRARARTARLTERFSSGRYHYVHGNHDEIARETLGAKEVLVVSHKGRKAVFLHGHQFDPIWQRTETLARSATWFSGSLRMLGLSAVAARLEWHDVALKHRRFGGAEGPYAEGARSLLERYEAHFIVLGHTHVPFHYTLPEGEILNTGTCSNKMRMYVSIDLEVGSVAQEILSPSPRQGRSLPAPLRKLREGEAL
ncbi:MAG: hypothetical protein D6812_07410 [Deltaproteobacteria bacterium]|nr:MAG: hypothetical protein D6812_07410 [Deltaproteobacteria bacterium]